MTSFRRLAAPAFDLALGALALAGLALGLGGCARGAHDRAAGGDADLEAKAAGLRFPGAPVVLVSIDTLRSDHLPAYGYRQVADPGVDAPRQDGHLARRP